MARNNCPHCDSAYTLCPGHPELRTPQPAEGEGTVVSHHLARVMLDSLDDYARMDAGVDAYGPRDTLERYIAQQEARPAATAKVPEGFVLVPIEPTYAMRQAGEWAKTPGAGMPIGYGATTAYRAMLAAAPAAPRGGVVDDTRRLDFLAGMWSKGLTPQLAAVIEAFRAGDSETIRATIDAMLAAAPAAPKGGVDEVLYTAEEVAEAMEVLRGREGSTALVTEVLDAMEQALTAALASAPSAGGVSEAVDEYKRRADAYFQTAERQGIRAERLAEALRELLRVNDAWHGSVNSEMAKARSAARALLRDQENKP